MSDLKRYAMVAMIFVAVIGTAIVGLMASSPGARVSAGVGYELVRVPTPEAVKLLIDRAPARKILEAVDASGLHPDEILYFGMPVLGSAIARDRSDVVAGLLERGANPAGGTNNSFQPLALAVAVRSPEIVIMLLEAGANPERKLNDYGSTPRSIGLKIDNAEIRRIFQELGQSEGPSRETGRDGTRGAGDEEQ